MAYRSLPQKAYKYLGWRLDFRQQKTNNELPKKSHKPPSYN